MASSTSEEHEFNEETEEQHEESENQVEEEHESEENNAEVEEEEEETEENNDEEHKNGEEQVEEHEEVEETAENNEDIDETEDKSANQADNDSDEEFVGFGEDEINTKKKSRQILSDSDNEDNGEETINRKKSKKSKKIKTDSGSDDNQETNEENADVNEEEDSELNSAQPSKRSHSDSDEQNEQNEEEEAPVKKQRPEKESDLEKMLKKNQAEKKKRRRKNADSEELNEMDNKISMIISEMKNVAAEDRAANEKSLTTLQKIKMLPTVMNMLQKSDYHATMIELGVLGAIAEWLAPLPDRSLPNISIRDQLIDALRDFGEINVDYLKSSGVGKAVMFLYKHSKETKSNKQKLERLINSWARPIFNLDSNFKQLTKEERQERDMEHIKQLNKRSSNEFAQGQTVDELLNTSYKRKKVNKNDTGDKNKAEEPNKHLRPGDPGFCPRARVPVPSSKDYIIRPKSSVEAMEGMSEKKAKKSESRLDKHKKRFIEIKKNAKSSRAVTMVAAGGK